MERLLEELFAFHCAPALAGIKPANLISVCTASFPELQLDLLRLNQLLDSSGICFRPVCRCENRILLLVYRSRKLEKHLADSRNREYLLRAGYPEGGLERLLLHLQKRLRESREFPHETGIFLGYPPVDVEGYRVHGGRHCKYSGYWKVYGDAEQAKALFDRYTHCRNALCARIRSGRSLIELFRAA